MVLALPELALLAMLILAFAVVYGLRKFTEGIIGMVHAIVGGIPLIGSLIGAAIDKVMQPMAHALGELEQYIDSGIGTSLHLTAQLVRQTYDFFERSSSIYATLARFVTEIPRFGDLVSLYRSLRHLIAASVHGVTSIIHHTTVVTQTVTKTVGTAVLPRLRTVEHEVEHVVEHDIASLRARTKTLEKEYAKLNKEIRAHPWTVVTTAFVGAVALALTRLGLEWIKCDNAKQVFKKRGCSLWTQLDKLLGLAGFLTIGFTFREFVDASETVAKGIGEFVIALEKPFDLALPPLPPPAE